MTPISGELHFRDLLRLSSPSHEISYATMAATKNLIAELPGRSKLRAGVSVVGGFWGTFDQLQWNLYNLHLEDSFKCFMRKLKVVASGVGCRSVVVDFKFPTIPGYGAYQATVQK